MSALENIVSAQLIERLGWTLVHFVWQGAAIAAVLAAALLVLRKRSANTRYVVSCVTLAAMVAMPVVTIWRMDTADIGRPVAKIQSPLGYAPMARDEHVPAVMVAPQEEAVMPVEQSVVQEAPAAAPVAVEISLRERLVSKIEAALPIMVAGWIAGVAGLSLWYLGGWTQLQRMRRRMVRPVGAELRERLARVAERVGVTRAVELVESALVGVPVVIGWLKPVILLPVSAVTGLDAEQLEALLAHELAHIKRCDY